MTAKVFLDTDVVISASLSKVGAAFQLLNNSHIKKYVSNLSKNEAQRTAKKLRIDAEELQKQLDLCIEVILKESLKSIRKKYGSYVHDVTDAHVLCGTVESKTRFLVTYNLKDFKIELIKREFDVIVLTPGILLQYLRSRE